MAPFTRHLVFVITSLFVFSACDCGRSGSVTSTYGEIGIVWTDEGVEQTNRDATYNFGTAIMGERVPKQMIVKNLSSGPLTLQTLERTEGSPVTVADAVVEGAAFEVMWKEVTVLAGEELAVDMFFTPPQAADATIEREAHTSKLLLTAGGTRADENTAIVTLIGNAEAGSCLLPKEIDFGAVPTGERFQLGFDLHNSASVNVAGFVGAPQSTTGDHTSFALASSSPQGTVSIPANSKLNVVFEFAPTENRPYSATVELRAGPQCPAGNVTLKGEGVDEVLTWSPTSIDFGFLAPNTTSMKQVLFKNLSKVPITLTNVAASMPSDFAVKAEAGGDPTKFTIPGGGVETAMIVGCKPTSLGLRNASLTFKTGMTKTPGGTIALKCTGGGPDIKVTPSPSLSFGRVAFVGGNFSVNRRLSVANVGTPAPNNVVEGNLHLGGVSAAGVPGQLPYLAVRPLNANTLASEIRVGLPSTYSSAKGIEAIVGKNQVDLTITLAPATAGLKEAELTIFSNDPDEAETKILITADAQQLPPCTYAITPSQLHFGLVTPPGFKELPFTIKNTSTTGGNVCELSGIDLAPGSDPAYSIVGGAIASKTLNPGESTQVVVRVAPQTAPANGAMVTLSGYVTFNVNSPTQPTGQVQLQTSVGPSCLTIAPDVLDFGTVKKGCSSATRTFTAYNTCSSDIYIQDISVSVPAGEPAGGTNCPGTTACPEFHITQKPMIPSGGLRVATGSTGTSFQGKYLPINFGADQGAYAVTVIQSGQTVTYLVSLSGNGDATGQQTDSFTQDVNPKADILLVIDSSCSMEDKQNQLANNFSAFLQYATSAGVDYHLGVTTTDVENAACYAGFCVPDGPKGKLLGDANNPKVLTPFTPNVNQLYSQKVKVGTGDSGVEKGTHAAMLALTAPLINNENAGFLRPDAKLAVVVVTDAADQSTDSIPYYMNRFLNIKGHNKATEFSFNVIGPLQPSAPSPCTYDNVAPDNGRWASITSQTSGVLSEICSSNWATTLQQLGKTAFGHRTDFFMNSQPDLTGGKGIEVKIDGVVIPATSGTTTNWTYDSTSNSVDFDPAKAPGPGQTLSITYFVACL